MTDHEPGAALPTAEEDASRPGSVEARVAYHDAASGGAQDVGLLGMTSAQLKDREHKRVELAAWLIFFGTVGFLLILWWTLTRIPNVERIELARLNSPGLGQILLAKGVAVSGGLGACLYLIGMGRRLLMPIMAEVIISTRGGKDGLAAVLKLGAGALAGGWLGSKAAKGTPDA